MEVRCPKASRSSFSNDKDDETMIIIIIAEKVYDFFLVYLIAVAVNKLQNLNRNAYIQTAGVSKVKTQQIVLDFSAKKLDNDIC